MWKRLLNIIKTRFATLMESRDPTSQTSRKRPYESKEKPAKKWQKVDEKMIQSMQEGDINKKRKVAILIAYNGKGYYGLQINPGFKTVESDFCKALVAVGLVPQVHADEMQKMSFQRAARTDKGVSAAGNVVSLKMLLNVEDIEGRLNEALPAQIRVMAWRRTTQSFNSKNFCDARTYIYMMPTYGFAPTEEIITDAYRTNPDILGHVNSILQNFVGTHNFYNFTSRIKADAANANRYIMSFQCGEPFVRDGVEFVVVSVKGASFVLHQIRKMIGLTIAIARGYCGMDAIKLAWQPEKIDIPIAPSVGLVLDQLHYTGYNQRFGNDGLHEALEWSSVQEKLDKFKEEHILTDIIRAEVKDRSMISWLATLHIHTFSTERADSYKVIQTLQKAKQAREAAAEQAAAESDKDSNTLTNQGEDDKGSNKLASQGEDKIDSVVLANQGEVDKDSNKLAHQSEDEIDSTALANQSEGDKETNKLTNQSQIDMGSIKLINQSEDNIDSKIVTNETDIEKTANQMNDKKATDSEKTSQNTSALHTEASSRVSVEHSDVDAQTSEERISDHNDAPSATENTAEGELLSTAETKS